MPETRINTEPPARLASLSAPPISQAQADELMRQWRGMGVWLSMWDARGRLLWFDRNGSRLWTTLMARSSQVRQFLRQQARAAARDETAPTQPPWGDLLRLTAVPVRQRQRIVGLLLAGSRRDGATEEFVRFCDRARIDATAAIGFLQRLPAYDDTLAEGWRGLLESTAHHAAQVDAIIKQTDSFTQNLDDTYEELSLVYGVTGMLSMTENPDDAITRVAREALTVSKTAGLILLMPGTTPADAPLAADTRPALRVLRIGDVGSDAAVCRRAAEQIRLVPTDRGAGPLAQPMPNYILRNRISSDAGWEWSRDWLEHAVALPLIHRDRWLGVMIAVNRTDGSDFSSVPVKFLRAIADRITTFLETRRLYDDLADLLMGLLHAMVSSIDAKDPYTCGHSERVAAMSRLLARQAGFAPAECQRVYLAGLLHDVGKIGVPDAVLCKPGKLTDDEFRVLRRHPQIGARILSRITQVRDLLPGVLYHHERMDGRGYPEGLAGENIPLLGRLICLADCFDAMTTNRTYRSALPVEAALAEIRRCAGTQFDPYLAERFLSIDLPKFLADSAAAAEAAAITAAPTHAILAADPNEVSAALQAVLSLPWKLPRRIES